MKKTNSAQQQAKRETAEDWYNRLQRNSSSNYRDHAYNLKKRGFTYCEIMDYFTGIDFSRYEILSLIETNLQPLVDRHKKKASELFNVPYESVTEKQRQVGKLVNFQLSYSCPIKPNEIK